MLRSIDFVARLIRVRRSHGALNAETPLTGAPLDATGIPDVEWLTPEGRPFSAKDWNDPARKHSWRSSTIQGDGMPRLGARPSRAAVLINASDSAIACELPGADAKTMSGRSQSTPRTPDRAPYIVAGDRYAAREPLGGNPCRAASRAARRQAPGAADHVLDALAIAAGIAPHWFDVTGKRHEVPADTKRALLTSLGLPADSTGEARASLACARAGTRVSSASRRNDTPPGWRNDNPAWRPPRRVCAARRPHHRTRGWLTLDAADRGRRGERGGDRRRRWAQSGVSATSRLPALPLGRHRSLDGRGAGVHRSSCRRSRRCVFAGNLARQMRVFWDCRAALCSAA